MKNKIIDEKTSLRRRSLLKIMSVAPLASLVSLPGMAGGVGGLLTAKQDDTWSMPWASGSTDLLPRQFPTTDIFKDAGMCQVSYTESTTEGPCYFRDTTGEDISTGLLGLPMQLCLRVVDSDCRPLANHQVEVWHCDHRGIYSGDISDSEDASRFNSGFCTEGDSEALNSTWYRGSLITDRDGRVNFKTCFPGWYAVRTIHIHFSITSPDARSQVISQLCFSDELAKDICTTHEYYLGRGEQGIPLASGRDSVFPASGYEKFLLTTEKNPNGTLLAYHTAQII